MSSPREPEAPRPSSGQHAGTVATENPGGGQPGERHEVGSSTSSRRDPPHVTENDERAQADAPVLPANASGRDRISTEEANIPIDDESAYDGRQSQDKDQPPSGG